MLKSEYLRTSTKAGLAGLVLGIFLEVIPVVFPIPVAEWLVPLVMYLTARFSATPENPGPL